MHHICVFLFVCVCVLVFMREISLKWYSCLPHGKWKKNLISPKGFHNFIADYLFYLFTLGLYLFEDWNKKNTPKTWIDVTKCIPQAFQSQEKCFAIFKKNTNHTTVFVRQPQQIVSTWILNNKLMQNNGAIKIDFAHTHISDIQWNSPFRPE